MLLSYEYMKTKNSYVPITGHINNHVFSKKQCKNNTK